ncbi:MAG: hypothetical protein QHC90_30560 [Shinella sp.]|jgi:hypothetical protein|nr:hypothetical protein [Shinella sp.]
MNTANLELQGLYLAMAAINDLLVRKQLLTHPEIRGALSLAATVVEQSTRNASLSRSNGKAVQFPLHFLAMASESSESGKPVDFHCIAKEVAERW